MENATLRIKRREIERATKKERVKIKGESKIVQERASDVDRRVYRANTKDSSHGR